MSTNAKFRRLEAEALAGIDLPEYPPFPPETVLTGVSRQQMKTLVNDELYVGSFSAAPALLRLVAYPREELMIVLSGKAIVTDENGERDEFVAGTSFVLKRGFTGTFEMIGPFRKISGMKGEAFRRRSLPGPGGSS